MTTEWPQRRAVQRHFAEPDSIVPTIETAIRMTEDKSASLRAWAYNDAVEYGASYCCAPKRGGTDFSEPGLDGRMFRRTVEDTRKQGAARIAAGHHVE